MWVAEHRASSAKVNSYVTDGLEKPWINSLSLDDITGGGEQVGGGETEAQKSSWYSSPIKGTAMLGLIPGRTGREIY